MTTATRATATRTATTRAIGAHPAAPGARRRPAASAPAANGRRRGTNAKSSPTTGATRRHSFDRGPGSRCSGARHPIAGILHPNAHDDGREKHRSSSRQGSRSGQPYASSPPRAGHRSGRHRSEPTRTTASRSHAPNRPDASVSVAERETPAADDVRASSPTADGVLLSQGEAAARPTSTKRRQLRTRPATPATRPRHRPARFAGKTLP